MHFINLLGTTNINKQMPQNVDSSQSLNSCCALLLYDILRSQWQIRNTKEVYKTNRAAESQGEPRGYQAKAGPRKKSIFRENLKFFCHLQKSYFLVIYTKSLKIYNFHLPGLVPENTQPGHPNDRIPATELGPGAVYRLTLSLQRDDKNVHLGLL